MSNIIVPDSIDPVYGWRVWELHDNHLYSPLKKTRWLPHQHLRAECIPGLTLTRTPRWRVLDAPPTSDQEIEERYGGPEFVPPRPPLLLPEGYNWVLIDIDISHDDDVPGAQCNCGIHSSKSQAGAILPLSWHSQPLIVGTVAHWGRTIIGSKGTRSQYAYPTVLYLCNCSAEEKPKYEQQLAVYGVPVYDAQQLEKDRKQESTTSPRSRPRRQRGWIDKLKEINAENL